MKKKRVKKVSKQRVKHFKAKKRTIHKKHLKVHLHKRNVKQSGKSSINKRDFETFSFGVQRLKELEQELNSLKSAADFPVETASIRLKLKNVSQIPLIEKEIKQLKLKIKGKYMPKRRKPKSNIQEDINKIKDDTEDIPNIKKQIRRLDEKIGRKEDIPEIKDEIRMLSEKSSSKKDINEIKRHIPDIKKEIKRLDEKLGKIEQKKKEKIGKIDSGVSVVVDADFRTFLDGIKSSLSERMRAKEKEKDNILRKDLEKREQSFREKYLELVNEFNKKYQDKVKTSLRKEVSEKFNRKLNELLNREKAGIAKKYKEELKKHANEHLRRDEQKLKEEYNDEIARDRLQIEKIKEKLVESSNKRMIIELAKKEKILKEELKREYDLILKKKMQEHEEEIKRNKFDFEMKLQQNKIKQALK